MTIPNKNIPLEDAGILASGLHDFVQGIYDLKIYHIKMQRRFLQEKGITPEELDAMPPEAFAEIKAEAKKWLRDQADFMPSLPRLEKILEGRPS